MCIGVRYLYRHRKPYEVEGVGPARKKALVREFGSLKGIRAASKEDLAGVVPDRVAETLWETLHQ